MAALWLLIVGDGRMWLGIGQYFGTAVSNPIGLRLNMSGAGRRGRAKGRQWFIDDWPCQLLAAQLSQRFYNINIKTGNNKSFSLFKKSPRMKSPLN